jgi:hypothetical protein
MANSRIHDTTKKKPIDLFLEEKSFLEPFYSNVKVVKQEHISHNKINFEELGIDIKYHTTISDYESILGDSYASA